MAAPAMPVNPKKRRRLMDLLAAGNFIEKNNALASSSKPRENKGVGLIIFEDEHLLVINKPAGWNTHAASPWGGEGLYEWLKHREPRWERLAIIHRLDKETSGLILFGKTTVANRSLSAQFEKRFVKKKYILRTDHPTPPLPLQVKSSLVRSGERYLNRPIHLGGEIAETRFVALAPDTLEAEPFTGKTHQIRVHAAANGFPILGDTLYGGTAAPRLFLHASEISLFHPATDKPISFHVQPDFSANPRLALRDAIIDSSQTNAYRLIHGGADGWPGLYLDRLGDFLLAQSEGSLSATQLACIEECARHVSARGVYHKRLQRQAQDSPQWLSGAQAPERIVVRENGAQFGLRFGEGYSVGLFLDQRGNRRRLLNWPTANSHAEVLNAFAYTCGFSVCAALSGARVTSLDLSKKYLDWGKENFALNAIDPAKHDFIFGDAFDWFCRLAKKNRRFDLIILDPPTFSRSKEHGVFRAEKDYGALLTAALPLLKSGGTILASCNAATFEPELFVATLTEAITGAGRPLLSQTYIPQPPDFPVHRSEPAYLKTVLLQVG
jgi:23S rRNA (cytosine1962-C5)-methyltransferase